MSFDRTLALRLQLVADFSAATREASQQLNAVVSGLKKVQELGKSIDVSGIDNLGVTIGKVAAGVADLEAKTRATAAATKQMKEQQVAAAQAAQASTALAVRSIGDLATAYNRAYEAAQKAAAAASGFVNAARGVSGAFAGVDGITAEFRSLGGQVSLASDKVLMLEDRLKALSRLRVTPALETTTYTALPPGETHSTTRAIPLGGGNSMPPPPSQAGGYGEPGGPIVPVPGGYYYPANVGGGPPPPPPPRRESFDWGEGGKRAWSMGSNMSSMGMGAAINFAMLAPLVKQLVGDMADIDDLMSRTASAFQGSPKLAAQFNEYLSKLVGRIGGDYKDTISSGYNLISSLPEGFNYNTPEGMQALQAIAQRNAMLTIVGSSSTHHVTNEETDLATNAMLKHFFGEDVHDPAKFLRDSQMVTNTLANLRMQTSTETDLAGNSFRQVGPMAKAMGIPFEDVAAMIGILAQNKTRGNEAGNAIKRILSRQNAPAGQLEKVQELFDKHGMNISLYNADGSMRDPFTMFESIYKAEHAPGVTQRDRAYINQQMSGLYAVKDFGNLLASVHEMGGAAGARAYGQRLVHGGGENGRDALNTQYTKRAQDNLLIQGQQTLGKTLDELHKVFKLIEPDLAKFLHGAGELVDWFDKLPDPVKKTVAEGLLFTAFLNGSVGVMGLFVGNLLKMVGGGMQLIGWLREVGGLAGIVTRLSGALMGAAGWAVRLGAGAVGLAAEMTPVGWVITGIVVAVAGLYLAWTRDWGGIREKTSAAVAWIKQEIPKIPEQLGWLVGRVVSFLTEMEMRWAGFWLHFPEIAVNAAGAVGQFFVHVVPQWIAGGIKWVTSMKDAMLKALPAIWDDLKKSVVDGIGHIFDIGGWMVDAGKKALTMFAQGAKEGAQAGKPHVQDALDTVLGSQVPHSEPKDSSSPLYGLGQSGKTAMQMFADGISDGASAVKGQVQVAFDNTFNGSLHAGLVQLETHAKSGKGKKKGRGPLHAYIIDIKNESLTEIEQMARELEAALAAKGAHLRDTDIFLTQHGKMVGKIHADPSVLRNAMGAGKDNSVQQLRDTLNMIRYAGGDAATILSKELSAAQAALISATDVHAKATIAGIIASLRSQYSQLSAKLDKDFFGKDGNGGKVGALDKAFAGAEGKQSQFDQVNQHYTQLLEQRINLRKNKELPTMKELYHERNLEEDQLRRLNTIYDDEIKRRDDILKKIDALKESMSKLNDHDATQLALKKRLQEQLDTYNMRLTTLNENLDTEQNDIGQVNTRLQENSKALTESMNASSAWERALVSATEKAGKSALNHLVDTFDAGIDKMLENAFGKWKGKGVSGSLKSAIGDFFSTFISELLHSAVANLMKYAEQALTDFFKNMVSKFSGSGGGSNSGGFGGFGSDSSSSSSGLNLAGTNFFGLAGGASTMSTDTTYSMVDGKMVAAGDSSSSGGFGGFGGMGHGYSLPDSAPKFLKNLFGNSGDAIGHGGGLGTVMQSEMYAQIFGQMMGGGSHTQWAELGGAIGSFIPIPGAGAILSFVGSLFGHADNPDAMPDVYRQQDYGQGLADFANAGMNGSPTYNANGTAYTENAQLYAQLGNKGEGEFIGDWIAAHKSEAEKLLGQGVVNMFQGNHGHITYQKDGMVLLDNGQTVKWDQLTKTAQEATQKILALGDAAGNSADKMGTDANRLADSFASLIWGAPAGFSMPDLLDGSQGGGGVGIGPRGIRKNPIDGPVGTPGHFFGVLDTAATLGTAALTKGLPSIMPGAGSGISRILKNELTNIGASAPVVNISLLPGAQVSNAQLLDEIIALMPQLKDTISNAVAERQYRNSRLRGDAVSVI